MLIASDAPRGRFLGMDIGGSSGRACLAEGSQPPRLWTTSGGSLALDRETVRDTVLHAIEASEPSAACFGIAGVRTALDDIDWLKAELGQTSCPVLVMTDAELALIAAFGTNTDGIVVCAGTGSVAVVRRDGVVHVVGGHGFLIDDGGSAYDIGRSLVAAALRDRDRGDTALLQEVEGLLREPVDAFVRRIYLNPADRQPIARLAEHVSSLRSNAARQILMHAADSLSGLARIAQQRFGLLPIRMSGGVFANLEIATVLQERFNASHGEMRPEVAAARVAEGILG